MYSMQKIKIDSQINKYAREAGLVVMTFATMVGMLELPSHTVNRVVLPTQVMSFASNSNNSSELNNPIRREKEETTSEYISYSESQRTPGRFGKY
jgi:hypothetical protein